jgi:hypothetical protein
MSLVITTNRKDEINFDRFSTWEAAYSYHNSLKQTLQLEPDSEVAVQSVKINKSSTMVLREGDLWYEFFGKDLNSTKTKEFDGPYRTIQCNPALATNVSQQSFSMEDFVAVMEKSINIGMPHPDIYGLLKFAVNRDATTNAYAGFTITSDELGALPANISTDTAHFNGAGFWECAYKGEGEDGKVDVSNEASGPRFTKQSGDIDFSEGSVVASSGFPLSHEGGLMKVNVAGCRSSNGDGTGYGGSTWQVGLCRAISRSSATNGNQGRDWLEYYQPHKSTGFGDTFGMENNFYDIVVSCEAAEGSPQKKLKVHQMTASDAGGVCLTEVIYFGFGHTHTNRIDLSATGGSGVNLKELHFQLDNEIMKISYEDDSGAIVDICDFPVQITKGAKKENLILPMGQTRWNLYPKLCFYGTGPSGNATPHIDIIEYTANVNTFNNYTIRNPDNNYYVRLEDREQTEILREIDTRPLNDMLVSPTDIPTYTPEGLATDKGVQKLDKRQIQYILSPSLELFPFTIGANMASMLGFEQQPLLAPSTNGVVDGARLCKYTYTSDTAPALLSTASLFVRLDNFTQDSTNAGTGRPSKILYHLPRFDTSNRDLGQGLFYQPPEMVYVKLNNSKTLYINTFDISIANDNEQLATDLVGKTIVVLHFRKSQNVVRLEGKA